MTAVSRVHIGVLALSSLLACGSLLVHAQAVAPLDAQKIGELLGTEVTSAPEDVVRAAWPQTDISVTVAGVPLPPFAGLTSWVAFQPDPRGGAMLMGDLVLLQAEVNPVMDVLLSSGLAVTGLHNHFFCDQPRVFFMHISGQGRVEPLAGGVRLAIDKIKELRGTEQKFEGSFGYEPVAVPSNVTSGPLQEVLGLKPEIKDRMVKFTFGRSTKMPCGCAVGSPMGVNTWAAFIGTDDHALVDGDFACLPGELQPTLRALRQAGINIVAIHNHMEDESPRVIFLHYWGVGPAIELARGVRAALDAQQQAAGSAAPR